MTTTEYRITLGVRPLQYHIYTLSNPETGVVFYVGSSVDTESRLAAHISERRYRGSGAKGDAIKAIMKTGQRPKLTIIDRITAIDPKIAHHVEQYWILRMKEDGAPLTNRNDATPSWNVAPPYSTIEHIKTIAHLPLADFRAALTEYYMISARSRDMVF